MAVSKSSRGRSAFRAHAKSTKVKNSDYERKIGAIRARAAVGELIDFQFLFSNFPDTFPKGRPHFAELFLADAKRKEHLREDGQLAPWKKVKGDPAPGAPASPPVSAEPFDPGTATVVKPADYSALRRELYTRGTPLRSKEDVSAASLQARGQPFIEYTRGALGNFLAWLQSEGELEPFNGKKRRLSARGFKEQTKMNPGKVQLPMLPAAAVFFVPVATVDASAEAFATPAEDRTILSEAEAAAIAVIDATELPESSVEAEEARPEAPKKARVLPPIGTGEIPTGKEFSTRDRRCLGMLILSVVSAAGGIRQLVNAEALYPKVRRLCGLGVEVKGNALGRFFYALYNLDLVESFGDSKKDEGGYQYKVTKETYQRVLDGEFGELPLERFGIEVKEANVVEVKGSEADEAAAPDDLIEGPADGGVDEVEADEAPLPPEPVEPLVEPVSVSEKRAPNAWDLRRHEQSARYYARLLRLCEREGISVLSSVTVRRVCHEFDEGLDSGVITTRIYRMANSGERIFRFVDPETKAWNFWFVDDFVAAVHSGRYNDVSPTPEASPIVVFAAPPQPSAPEPLPEAASEPVVELAPETAPFPSSSHRVRVRRAAVVPRHIHDANLAELRATRAAMEALQTQVEGLPNQLRDIVSDALRRQAEDFKLRLAAEQGQREALQAQFVELRQRHHDMVSGLADEGEAEYHEVEDLKARVVELEARIDRHLAK